MPVRSLLPRVCLPRSVPAWCCSSSGPLLRLLSWRRPRAWARRCAIPSCSPRSGSRFSPPASATAHRSAARRSAGLPAGPAELSRPAAGAGAHRAAGGGPAPGRRHRAAALPGTAVRGGRRAGRSRARVREPRSRHRRGDAVRLRADPGERGAGSVPRASIPKLERVARTLGDTGWRAFRRVTLPLAGRGIARGRHPGVGPERQRVRLDRDPHLQPQGREHLHLRPVHRVRASGGGARRGRAPAGCAGGASSWCGCSSPTERQ